MHGNTFVNLFLLGLVEGPGNVLGYVASNKLEIFLKVGVVETL